MLSLLLPDQAELRPEYRKDLLSGVVIIHGQVQLVSRTTDGKSVVSGEQELTAIPYYAWAHRGRGQMAVWLAREVAAARPLPGPTIAHTSRATASFGGAVSALADQLEPRSSIGQSNPFFQVHPGIPGKAARILRKK